MECPVCYREWDSEHVIPRNLPCGHSYCEEDLFALFKLDGAGPNGQITCPTCCVEHQMQQKNEIQNLIKNWAVIAYAETFARQKKELEKVGVSEEAKTAPVEVDDGSFTKKTNLVIGTEDE